MRNMVFRTTLMRFVQIYILFGCKQSEIRAKKFPNSDARNCGTYLHTFYIGDKPSPNHHILFPLYIACVLCSACSAVPRFLGAQLFAASNRETPLYLKNISNNLEGKSAEREILLAEHVPQIYRGNSSKSSSSGC